MKLLVFGQTGQVAREFARVVPQDWDVTFLGRDQADFADPQTCAKTVLHYAPEAVLNLAAWTAVDRAESEEEAATLVNATTPTAIAQICAQTNLPLLHISTDYVFNGEGQVPFLPNDPVAPLNAYGRSKLRGEQGIQQSGARSLILRTSWVVSAHGTNFVKTMLRLGRERTHLNVVADQIGGPTPAADIAAAALQLLPFMREGHKGGVYHFSGAPDVSWADFAREIMVAARLSCAVHDIATAQYPTPARRPPNSRLDCVSLLRDFGIARPDWRVGLRQILAEIGA